MYDLESLRESEFPLSAKYLYFNHAGISPLPRRTQTKMRWAVDRLAGQPTDHFVQDGMPMMEAFSRRLAGYINTAVPHEIVPVTTTSTALGMVSQAIAWEPGDNVLFCDLEFPANAFPWLSLQSAGVEARLVPAVAGGLTLPALASYCDGRTRLIAASAVQFFSGHRTDLEAIGAFCREQGILFVVDAIQSIGHIPLNVQAMHIDVLACGGQKSFLGPPGIGFLYVREEVCANLRPRAIGPNATVDYLHWLNYNLTPLPGAQRFWAGTPNLVGMFGLLASLDLIEELGVEHIDRHTSQLTAVTLDILTRLDYQPITVAGQHGPIATFKSGLSDEATDNLVAYLAENNVTVVKHLDAAGEPHIRLSYHCYNSEDELNQFETIMKSYRKSLAGIRG